MFRMSPTLRISLGVLSLTLSLLLAAELLGLLPNMAQPEMDARKNVSEALAIQLSLTAVDRNLPMMTAMLESVVERNADMLSVGMRKSDGSLAIEAGDHQRFWKPSADGRSTPTHLQVPIYQDQRPWGTVELSFVPLKSTVSLARLESFRHSLIGLLFFIGLAGFGLYFIFMRRALRELDPAGVIPERVKAAFDALSEGVLIMDEHENIILANAAFAAKVEQAPDALIGHKVSDLDWRPLKSGGGEQNLPWRRSLREASRLERSPLLLCTPSGSMLSFMVNCAPILDGKSNTRGVLSTFDDLTQVEQQNAELKRTMVELEQSKDEVNRQNHELRFLATRDSLTGCLNRRAFFECCEAAFSEAHQQGQPLSCIMADIDHFKSINDRFGHAAGDKVIRFVAEVLKSEFRSEDLVCRYGGEEFCIILPGLPPEEAVRLAERVRRRIREGIGLRLEADLRVTISLGVSALEYGAETSLELVNQGDSALYAAKEGGRNRVAQWTDSVVVRRLSAVAARAVGRSEATARLPKKIRPDHTGEQPGALTVMLKSGFDEVTGLPGARLFSDRVEQMIAGAQRNGRPVALLSVEIENFREVHDALGSEVSDGLLKTVGDRIQALVRGTDTVAKLSDDEVAATVSRASRDEFVVALGNLTSTESITWIVQRILEGLAGPCAIAAHEIYLTSNIGISVYPGDAHSTDGLLRCASVACRHVADIAGPNRYAFFARDMNELSYKQIQLDAQMRHAIQAGQFRLYYQPKIDLRNGKITAVEALVRWLHPEQGLIPPLSFLPIAERSGFIAIIGEWVLRTTCQQIQQWRRIGIDQVRVAVNVSATQLHDGKFVERVAAILAETGVAPGSLELEVTETVLMQDIEGAVRQLQELRRLGIHIAIDDFGTGYSSLSYLKEFAADTLKIDGSFVADIANNSNDAALVAAIIAMAHRLGLQAVAEGVETAEQLAHLRTLQCDSAQGYLFSRPVPAEEILPLLRSGEPLVAPPETDLTARMSSTLSLALKRNTKNQPAANSSQAPGG